MSEPKLCLSPGCGRSAKTRGLCATCYAAARTLIKEGKLDPVKLEAEGKILPAKAWHGNTPGPARLWFLGQAVPMPEVAPKPRVRKKPESDELRNLAPVKGTERPVGPEPPNIDQAPRIEGSGPVPVAPVNVSPVTPVIALHTCIDCGKLLDGGVQFAETKDGSICVPCYQTRASKAAEQRLAQQAINGPG